MPWEREEVLDFLLGLCLFLFNGLQLLLYGWFVFGIWGITGDKMIPSCHPGPCFSGLFLPSPRPQARAGISLGPEDR